MKWQQFVQIWLYESIYEKVLGQISGGDSEFPGGIPPGYMPGFVSLCFALFTPLRVELYLVCVFSCTVLFVSISQVIGCEDHLRNDLDGVWLGVKLFSIGSVPIRRNPFRRNPIRRDANPNPNPKP